MQKIKIYGAMLIALLIAQTIVAQQVYDARGVGMAFSNAADARGLEQIGLNPAMLAVKHPFNFELNIFSANAGFTNNSVSKGFYEQYFTTGDSLTLTDKSDILNAIPTDGLQGQVSGRFNTLAVYMPHFSLALTGIGSGYFNLPKEIAEIGLYGNEDLNRTYDFSSADASGWGGAEVSLGLGFNADFLRGGMFDFAAIGFSSKYIIGLQYAEVEKAEGYFQNIGETNNFVKLDGLVEARRATGGSGFAFDMGVVLQSKDKITISAALLNAIGSVKWNAGTEMDFYSVNADSFGVSSDGFNTDSIFVTNDSTYAIDPFSTRIPAVFDLGMAYHATKHFLLTTEFEQNMSKSMGTLKSTRLAFGTEFTGIPLLPLRVGMSFGGARGFSTAFGMGLNLKYWFVDLALVNHGGFSTGKARGFTVAATTRFRF